MKFDPPYPNRQSNRLKGYDYAQAGMYFITICVNDRECLLGKIEDGKMILNGSGKIAQDYLMGIPEKYTQTELHEHVIMPNHIHAIIEIKNVTAIHESPVTNNGVSVGAIHESPETDNGLLKGAIHESPLQTNNDDTKRAIRESPLQRDQRRKMLLSKIIGWYKMNTAKNINIINGTAGKSFWQRNYYDHIIRNEASWQDISDYIVSNPAHWKEDRFNKNRTG
jgi:putative transposase